MVLIYSESREPTLVVLPFVYLLEVKDTRIVVILTGEYNGVKISRMGIGDGMA
jgi:hypothetical protein